MYTNIIQLFTHLLYYTTTMAKKDLKKIEHANERHEVSEDIVAIRNLKSFSQEKKDELIQWLLDKKELTQTPVEKACPFPQHKGYVELWKKLKDKPEMQKEMKANMRISADGKIEIIKMKKKFSILTAEHNGKDIFKWEHEDQYGKKWIAWVTYLTGRAAEQECDKQKKNLLKDKAEVEQFISYFPWETTKEKIFNFVSLFGLEKAGCWHPNNEIWGNVGSVGFALLSRVYGDDDVYEVIWDVDYARINRYDQGYPSPFVACEDCAA